jgi:hypothetical protein
VPHPIGVLPAFCQHQQQMALKVRRTHGGPLLWHSRCCIRSASIKSR